MARQNNQTEIDMEAYEKIHRSAYISELDEHTMMNLNKWIALRQLVCRELVNMSTGPAWDELKNNYNYIQTQIKSLLFL